MFRAQPETDDGWPARDVVPANPTVILAVLTLPWQWISEASPFADA